MTRVPPIRLALQLEAELIKVETISEMWQFLDDTERRQLVASSLKWGARRQTPYVKAGRQLKRRTLPRKHISLTMEIERSIRQWIVDHPDAEFLPPAKTFTDNVNNSPRSVRVGSVYKVLVAEGVIAKLGPQRGPYCKWTILGRQRSAS